MTKRICLALSHAIEEWMQLDLLHSLGYEVASLGAYIDPAEPHVDIRPPLPQVPRVPEVVAASEATKFLGEEPQENIPGAVLDWLGDDGIIIYHHFLPRLFKQWPRLNDWRKGGNGRRIIWRSVGQSVANNEREASPYRISGLERVAYSPREQHIPDYSGHDAIIRFWGHEQKLPWNGEDEMVVTLGQHMRQREPWTNWSFWDSATRGLPRKVIGPGSEVIDGLGEVSYENLKARLLAARGFVFTGTQPASYTLGLIEALHAGTPTVSIGPEWMNIDFDGHTATEMFEAYELAPLWSNDPNIVRHICRNLILDRDYASEISRVSRTLARTHFDRDTVGKAWADFLA